jgi:hypothetical protein
VPSENVNHRNVLNVECKCYLQGDRPVIVAPCFNPDDFTPSPIFDAMIADVKRKAAQS